MENEAKKSTVKVNGKEVELDIPLTEEKKKQKVSPSYTMRAMGENIDKLEELKLLTKEEADEMRKIHAKAAMKFLGVKM